MKNILSQGSPMRQYISRGFTLVELLVSLTIGLLLTIVIAQLFLGSRQSYATTDDLSRLQENMRYSQQLLMRTIHMAGFKSAPNQVTNAIFSGANVVIQGTEGGGTVPDSITVRFQGSGNGTGTPDGSVTDCLGNRVDAGVIVTNTFTIAPGANGANALFCNNGANNWEIVPDVENMKVLYGEDTDGDLTIDRYVTFGNVTNVNNVINVRVALLFRTANLTNVVQDTKTYNLNGTIVGPFNDLRMRRILTSTINLRNRAP
jgi:type IV pilus assembly protein PilW